MNLSIEPLILSLILFLPGVALPQKSPQTTPPPIDIRDSILHNGIWRRFLIHLPQKPGIKGPLPLVLVLHGGGGTPAAVARLTGFNRLADSAGFVVVYPQAVNRRWNDGRRVQKYRSHREDIDDTGFIAALIDTLSRRLPVDRSRVFACGISNGGMMCHRLGCELADRLAAIATVAAALPENLAARLPTGIPLPVLMFNGTADPFVPYEGGTVGIAEPRGRVLGAEATARLWAESNRASPARIEKVAEAGAGRQETFRITYPGRAEVVLYKIIGGGHVWPGGERRAAHFGPHVEHLNATRLIWEFFARYRRH